MKTKALILSFIGLLASSNTYAVNNLLDPSVSTSPILNNSMIRIDGTFNDLFGQHEPWTTQIFSQPTECLRIFIPTSDFDSKLTVIAPNGTVYRDDNSGGLNRPLVKIRNAPNKGWYTVQVSSANGSPLAANFGLMYGRYPESNVNCDFETLPI